MNEETQELVRERAKHVCEYCGIPEAFFIQRFQIEHIVSRSHRGDVWTEHFQLEESGEIRGLTDVGRTTTYVLEMNAERRVELRRAIAAMSDNPIA